MEFLNLEDTRLRLSITLIFNYKRGTHKKKRGDRQLRTKPKRNKRKRELN